MTTKPQRSLADAVHAASGDTPATVPRTGKTRGRAGKRGIVIYVEPALAKALKRLAVDEDTTLQALGVEAFGTLIDQRDDRRREGSDRSGLPSPGPTDGR